MEYRIIFTIYSIVFTLMLLITLVMKKRKKTIRTKLYTLLVMAGMLLAISETAVILTYLKLSTDKLIFSINWKTRMSSIFLYMEILVWYYDVLVNGEKEKTLLKTIVKSKKNIAVGGIFTFFILFYIITGDYYIYGPEEIVFIKGTVGYGMLIMVMIAAIYVLVTAIRVRKERRNVFLCFVLLFSLLVSVTPLQIAIEKISFMPFLATFILYIIYHNIENPDIDLLEEVTVLKENIDKSSNAKLEFLYNLSYDLINPMNVIVSLSDSLSNATTIDRERIMNDTVNIRYAGNTLLDSIDNILDISETDNNENELNLREYNVLELLNRMKTLTTNRLGAKQITFEMDIADNISSNLIGDIAKIQKILMNILNNAIKYTEIGKIKMEVGCSNIKNGQILQIKISDTGCGIKDEDKANIFNDDVETTGLGLALTKKYLDAMKGTIKVESIFGAGSTFIIEIPQQTVGSRLIAEDKLEEQQFKEIETIDCSKFKALVVDDDILDIKVTTKLLEKYKFQIDTLTSSVECVDRIKMEEEFDIIFMDHKMPELDGVEAMKVIKSLEGYKTPKIIVLTANAVTGAREYYKKEGFDDYISKPIDVNELDKIIKRNIKPE